MVDIRDVILIIAGVLDLTLGTLILIRNRKSHMHLSFAFFSFCLAGWALGVAFFRITQDLSWALFWAKEYYIAASFIAATLLYFAHVFPEGKPPTRKWTVLILAPSILHAVVLAMPGYLTKRVVMRTWGKEVILGMPEYLLYTIYFLPFFYGALYILWSKYRQYGRVLKRQIYFVLFSIFIASIFGVGFNLFLPWFGNYQLIYIGPPFTMIIFWYISYAIVQHQWLDIRLVAARTVAYSLLISVIGIFYITAAFLLSAVLFQTSAPASQLLLYTFLTFVVAMSFDRLKKFLERTTDRFFFKDQYDATRLLYTLGSIMSTTIELSMLAPKVLETLIGTMKITRGSFVLIDKDSLYTTISYGYEEKPIFHYSQILPLLGEQKVVVFDVLQESILKEVMRNLGVTISVTLRVKGDTVGLLLLSDKLSGDLYEDQDINVLSILAPEVAVAIQNAHSYEEIKRFNITLRQEVEKATAELKKANVRLEELDRLKDDFVSIASHELRTPMTAIKSYLWMALNKRKHELTSDLERYLNSGYIAVDRLINLVNDMLNVSRIESGRVALKLVPTNIIALVQEVASDLGPKFTEKRVKLEVMITQVPQVMCDKNRIYEVLLNLLGNALKFTPTGGSVSLRFQVNGDFVYTTVSDTGQGIDPKDHVRLFTKFGRIDSSYVASSTSTGTGLGLYITKSLIALHRGTIEAASSGIGKGAQFTFSLPTAGSL